MMPECSVVNRLNQRPVSEGPRIGNSLQIEIDRQSEATDQVERALSELVVCLELVLRPGQLKGSLCREAVPDPPMSESVRSLRLETSRLRAMGDVIADVMSRLEV
jgi:hypothetical protein